MAVAFDAATNSGDTNSTSITFSHTCSGSDRVLYVFVNAQAGNVVTGVTYNSVSMTQLVASDGDAGSLGFYGYNYLYRLIAPSTGANNVVVSASSSGWMRASAWSGTGGHQTTPEDTYGANNEVTSANEVSLTITNSNCWVISWCIFDNSVAAHISPQSGITSRAENTDGVGDSAGTVATGASALGWQTSQGSQRSTVINVALRPSGAATATETPGPTLLTLGVG